MTNREKGYFYEEKAKKILEKEGYEILEMNYYSKVGEIDIIAEKKDENRVVFVEVKYRKNLNFGHGSESITRAKLKKIYGTARKYLTLKGFLEKNIRFDMIVFTEDSYEWVKNILWGDEL